MATRQRLTTSKMAHYRMDQHEKLCRIMQKQTQDIMSRMMQRINRLELVVWISSTALIGGMFTILLKVLFQNNIT